MIVESSGCLGQEGGSTTKWERAEGCRAGGRYLRVSGCLVGGSMASCWKCGLAVSRSQALGTVKGAGWLMPKD